MVSALSCQDKVELTGRVIAIQSSPIPNVTVATFEFDGEKVSGLLFLNAEDEPDEADVVLIDYAYYALKNDSMVDVEMIRVPAGFRIVNLEPV